MKNVNRLTIALAAFILALSSGCSTTGKRYIAPQCLQIAQQGESLLQKRMRAGLDSYVLTGLQYFTREDGKGLRQAPLPYGIEVFDSMEAIKDCYKGIGIRGPTSICKVTSEGVMTECWSSEWYISDREWRAFEPPKDMDYSHLE